MADLNMELPALPWGDDFEAWLEVRTALEVRNEVRAYAQAAIAADRLARGVPSKAGITLTAAQIAAGAAVLGDDGKPIGRNTAIMVADAMGLLAAPAQQPENGESDG